MKAELDILRRVRICGHALTLWDTHRRDERGQTIMSYRLRYKGKTIFEGEDFAGSPMDADDSDATVGSILGFLTLRPGDTDKEYFDGYTPEQIAWRDEHAEELGNEAYFRFKAKEERA